MEKYWQGKNWQIWRIVSYSPNFFLPIFTCTPKMHSTHTLTIAYLPNFSLSIAFTFNVDQNFPLPNISCIDVYGTKTKTCSSLAHEI